MSFYCQEFLYQYRPCLSQILPKGSIVVGKLRGIQVLPFPQILKSIISNENLIGTASMSLCFVSTMAVHFIHGANKVSKYFFFFFISLIFILHIVLRSIKETPPSKLITCAIPRRGINTEKRHQKGWGNFKDRSPSLGQYQPQ